MSSNKKTGEEAPTGGLRRSSRSTRGSIKPLVDLTKEDKILEQFDKKHAKKDKTKKVIDVPSDDDSDVEEVPPDDDNDDDDEDEDFEEPTTKSRRSSTKTKTTKNSGGAAAPAATKKKQPATKKETKTSKKAVKKEVKEEKKPAYEEEYLYELDEKELKEVNNAFDMNCSEDGSELLSHDDLKTAIRSMGFEPRVNEIQKLLEKFGNKDGKVNRDGFHKIMAFKMGSTPGMNDNVLNDEISRVFNLLDLDKTGMITKENLKSISAELNEEITDEEIHEMIAEADLDGDLMINKLEFYNIMKKTSLY